jgi:hypothetical protein
VRSLQLNKFPTFCAALVGLYISLQAVFQNPSNVICKALSRRGWKIGALGRLCLARFVAAIVSSWLSLQLLNSGSSPIRVAPKSTIEVQENGNRKRSVTDPKNRVRSSSVRGSLKLRGKTLDLTLLATVRAVEALTGQIWGKYRASRVGKDGPRKRLEDLVSQMTDSSVFAVSAGAVMWAWFYLPERLPQGYRKWIGEAAQVDRRLVKVLQDARKGQFLYGKDTGEAHILQSMCEDYGWPSVWGDPAKTIPVPCQMVHMGAGSSCHWHAVIRFTRSFKFALTMYLPIQLLMKGRSMSPTALIRAMREAVQSSAFLATFIALFYYGVCLSRTILGPRIISNKIVSRQDWDSGLCVGAGCMLCGWSILIEAAKKRQEMASFVAPRAAAILLPRRYDLKVISDLLQCRGQCANLPQYFWREQLAFSMSIAVLFTFAQEDRRKVRGIMGSLLHGVLA